MFEKGNTYGKTSHKPDHPDLKTVRKLTRSDFEMACNKYLQLDSEEIAKLQKSKKLPMIDMMIVSIIHKAIVHGDQKRLDFLLDRLIGKVVQPIEYVAPPPPVRIQFDLSQLPTETLRQLAEATERDVTPESE